jgi:hypothetical protein
MSVRRQAIVGETVSVGAIVAVLWLAFTVSPRLLMLGAAIYPLTVLWQKTLRCPECRLPLRENAPASTKSWTSWFFGWLASRYCRRCGRDLNRA